MKKIVLLIFTTVLVVTTINAKSFFAVDTLEFIKINSL